MNSARVKPKSRVTAETVRVTIHSPKQGDDNEPPGYSGHNGGSFQEAGYMSGRGQFGFQQGPL